QVRLSNHEYRCHDFLFVVSYSWLSEELSLLSSKLESDEVEHLSNRIHHRPYSRNLPTNHSGGEVPQPGILCSGHLCCDLRNNLACGLSLSKPDLPLDQTPARLLKTRVKTDVYRVLPRVAK